MTVTKRIREELRLLGISVREFEKELGIGIDTFYSWDRNSLRLDMAIKVALYLGISLDDLCQDVLKEGGMDIDKYHEKRLKEIARRKRSLKNMDADTNADKGK